MCVYVYVFVCVLQMFTSYQEVRVQEKMQCLAMGALPCSITVLLQDELADACRPGGEMQGKKGALQAGTWQMGKGAILNVWAKPGVRGRKWTSAEFHQEPMAVGDS